MPIRKTIGTLAPGFGVNCTGSIQNSCAEDDEICSNSAVAHKHAHLVELCRVRMRFSRIAGVAKCDPVLNEQKRRIYDVRSAESSPTNCELLHDAALVFLAVVLAHAAFAGLALSDMSLRLSGTHIANGRQRQKAGRHESNRNCNVKSTHGFVSSFIWATLGH